jgi:hypothetical protein
MHRYLRLWSKAMEVDRCMISPLPCSSSETQIAEPVCLHFTSSIYKAVRLGWYPWEAKGNSTHDSNWWWFCRDPWSLLSKNQLSHFLNMTLMVCGLLLFSSAHTKLQTVWSHKATVACQALPSAMCETDKANRLAKYLHYWVEIESTIRELLNNCQVIVIKVIKETRKALGI